MTVLAHTRPTLRKCRFAPTPSGFLHRGNAVNALLNSWWADSLGASLGLRVDDIDSARVRREYVQDIFDMLPWLGIAWSEGPQSIGDVADSRETRIQRAREALDEARDHGLTVYACTCSRRDLGGIPTGGCPRGCRTLALAHEPGSTALRVAVPPSCVVDVDGQSVDVEARMGDFVIWRRDDLPAYQWLSVVEDTDAGITHILRGEDLRDSSAAQVFLARHLSNPHLTTAVFLHHPLITDSSGVKLSKSQLTAATTSLLSQPDEPAPTLAAAQALGAAVGIAPSH